MTQYLVNEYFKGALVESHGPFSLDEADDVLDDIREHGEPGVEVELVPYQ